MTWNVRKRFECRRWNRFMVQGLISLVLVTVFLMSPTDCAVAQSSNTVPGDSDQSISDIAFSSDNAILAIARRDGKIQLYDLASGKSNYIQSKCADWMFTSLNLEFIPDKKERILTATNLYDCFSEAWNLESPEKNHGDAFTFTGMKIRLPVCSPDGTYMAFLLGQDEEQFAARGKHLERMPLIIICNLQMSLNQFIFNDMSSVRAMAFSDNGRYFAAVGDDGIINAWTIGLKEGEWAGGAPPKKQSFDCKKLVKKDEQYPIRIDYLHSIDFSDDNSMLVTANEHMIFIWKLKEKEPKLIMELDKSRRFGEGVYFLPNNDILFYDTDKKIKTYSLKDKKIVRVSSEEAAPEQILLSPDGKIVASVTSGSKNVRLWNAEDLSPMKLPVPDGSDEVKQTD